MLATCNDSRKGLRDCALLCFGFASGGRRRSEIAGADLRDLRKTGDESYIYRLGYSKTQQAGITVDSTPDKPILGRSDQALSAWLEAAGIREGAIFRRIWKEHVAPALLPGSVAMRAQEVSCGVGMDNAKGADIRTAISSETSTGYAMSPSRSSATGCGSIGVEAAAPSRISTRNAASA